MSSRLLNLTLAGLTIAALGGCEDREKIKPADKPTADDAVRNRSFVTTSSTTQPMTIQTETGSAAESRLNAFVKYCGDNGLKLVTAGDLEWNQWRVKGNNDRTYSIDFVFKLFPANTSSASMKEALLFTSIRFPLISEAAGLAVSDPTEHGRGPLGQSPEAKQASKNARDKMVALLKSYKVAN